MHRGEHHTKESKDAVRGGWSLPCLSPNSLSFPPLFLQMRCFHICDSWGPASVVLVQENRVQKPNMMSLELQFCPWISQSRKRVPLSPHISPPLCLLRTQLSPLPIIPPQSHPVPLGPFSPFPFSSNFCFSKAQGTTFPGRDNFKGGKERQGGGSAGVPLAGEGKREAGNSHWLMILTRQTVSM